MKTRDVIDSLRQFARELTEPTGSHAVVHMGLTLMAQRLENDGIEDFQGSIEEASGRLAIEEADSLRQALAQIRIALHQHDQRGGIE